MDNQQTSPFEFNHLPWLRWLIIPRHMPETVIGQQQARQLTFYLFVTALATIANFLIWALVGRLSTFTFLSLILGVGLYSSTRLFHYKTVAIIASITILTIPYLLLIISPQELSNLVVFFLITCTLLISSQFLSLRANLQIAILVIITAFLMNSFILIDESIFILSILVPLIILTVLTMLNAHGRERLIAFAHQNENPTQASFFQNAVNLIPEAAFIQADKMIVEANDAALTFMGLTRDDIIGQPASRFISAGTSSNYNIDNNTDNLTIRYDDLMHLDKGEQVVQITASTITYVDKLATLIIIRPYEATSDNTTLLENIVDASLNAVIVTDTDLEEGPHIVMVNPAFCAMTGYKESELLGRTPRILQGPHTERDILDKLRIGLENGVNEFRSEATNYRKDGSPFRVLWLIRPVYDAKGDITHYLSVQQEITQQEQLQRNLREREENLSIISEVMTDYAYMFEVAPSNTLRFTWITGAIEAITGLSYEEAMLNDDWYSIVHEDDQAFYELHTKALLDGQTRTLEYRIWHQDGSLHWIQDKAHPITDDKSGAVVRVLGAAHDITDRIEAQEVLKSYVVQQAVIAELGLLALNSNDLEQLLDHVIVLCEQVLQVSFISIFEHDAPAEQLTCLRISDRKAPFVENISFTDDPKQSLVGYTLNSSEAVISDNLQEEERFTPLDNVVERSCKSAIGVVILGRDEPFGVLSAYSDKPEQFAHDEVYFLQAIANILGTFIVRSQAQRAEKEQTEFAEALRDATSIINSQLELPEVLNKITNYVLQVVPQAQQASIMLFNEETQRYHYQTMWGFDDNIVETMTELEFLLEDVPLLRLMDETGEPVHIKDTAQDTRWVVYIDDYPISSYLGAPIIVGDETIGFIDLYSFEVSAFDTKDAIRLKTFADKTSTAIVNARKQEDLEYKVTQRTIELRQEQEQLATILSATGDGIFYTEDNFIAFVNQALIEMTGFSEDELLGSDSEILLPRDMTEEEETNLLTIRKTITQGDIWRDTARIRRKDDSSFDAGLTISQVKTSENDIRRAVTIVRDLSREKELENLKRTFIAAAAHDLRSPISSLKMRMYMIKREPAQLDHHLGRVNDIIDHVNHLVNDLLDAHGRIVLRPQNIILQDVLDKVVDNLSLEASEKDMVYEYHSMPEPAPILADENRLTQVFTNLITNAIHYTDAKGCIHITTKFSDDRDRVHIEIQDTGMGIPSEEQESIFLPFYRTQDNESRGNGLGLSITREIVELHGGEIHVESLVGEGSTFIVILPLSNIG